MPPGHCPSPLRSQPLTPSGGLSRAPSPRTRESRSSVRRKTCRNGNSQREEATSSSTEPTTWCPRETPNSLPPGQTHVCQRHPLTHRPSVHHWYQPLVITLTRPCYLCYPRPYTRILLCLRILCPRILCPRILCLRILCPGILTIILQHTRFPEWEQTSQFPVSLWLKGRKLK